jgi:hypothetical protein
MTPLGEEMQGAFMALCHNTLGAPSRRKAISLGC